MDQVIIKDLLVKGILGVYEWEREIPQSILINVTLFTDTSIPGKSDDIADCVDYHELAEKIRAFVENSHRFTVEALAEDLANLCLLDPQVKTVRLRVEKPQAIEYATAVGVEIERNNISPEK